MKIIIPMAGMGKRMRPHTLTVPKPLLPIAGKPMVQWIAEDIAKVCTEKIEEIAFIIGNFGKEVEGNLVSIANALGAEGKIYYQPEALGTAHAILCAENSLNGKVVVAFADTLFSANFKMKEEEHDIIWVQKIEDPSQFGVVTVNEHNVITGFVEKPQTFVSDLAIIGIYYFRDGENLKKELKYLINNQIMKSGEYQLTDALENMKNKGMKFSPGAVDEWLDCGNKNATVHTNQRILELNVVLENSEIGPYVSVGNHTEIRNATVQNSIVQTHTKITGCTLKNAMIGNHVELSKSSDDASIGDYSTIK
jgi:glucose-1-phosphate thymidylyltransferase